ncbi:hypothetical protein Daus18300_012054 [Diaporthe australafricana]|uniref:Cytochrome P450 n=1 Tax=Diaporthe australafricana TaxID=127596 RepID=A0ABR3W4T0_9PEZI
MILQLIVGSALAYFGWSIISLERNVRKARSLNVPIVRLPIDPVNFLWVFLQGHVWNVLDRLPVAWSSWPDSIRFSYRGWQFREKSSPAVRFGPIWALVTPVTFYLQFTDPDAINELFSRRSDFIRPVKNYKLLEVYGPCISTAGWDDWPRHRKVLAAPFNESIMSFVWGESLRQASSMLRSWSSPTQSMEGISSVQKDTRTLSLNVLAATGFRKSYDFRGSSDMSCQDEAGGYRDALQTVLDNAILIMILPYEYLQGFLVPKKLVRIGNAARSFKKHMMQMLEDETSALRDNKPGSGGLMSSFVRALDRHEREAVAQPNLKGSKDGKRGLSIDEIFGNLFVINFAGHDTTANTLAFIMLLLAAHPEVQDWAAEELLSVEAIQNSDIGKWDYNTVFPRLKRCQAVLLETLRIYPPIMSLPKWTKERAQTLRVGEKVLVIPPGVGTSPNLLAMHTHPKYWADPFVWRPSRWIVGGPAYGPESGVCDEDFWTPLPHTYFPFSDGPQNCPGAKFAKVEVVAVLACLLKSHRLGVKKGPGEAEEVARERVVNCTNDVNLEILLRMRDADCVKLVCTKA